MYLNVTRLLLAMIIIFGVCFMIVGGLMLTARSENGRDAERRRHLLAKLRRSFRTHAEAGRLFRVTAKAYVPPQENCYDVRQHTSAKYWLTVAWADDESHPYEWQFNVPALLFDRTQIGSEVRADEIGSMP